MRPEVEHEGKRAAHDREPLHEVISDAAEQEIVGGGAPRHPVAAAHQKYAVEDVMGRAHGRSIGGVAAGFPRSRRRAPKASIDGGRAKACPRPVWRANKIWVRRAALSTPRGG